MSLFDLGFGILFLISRKQKSKCSQLCEQKANIREKQKNIALVQFTVVQKGYINLDYICLFDLGFGILFLISWKHKSKCSQLSKQKANILEKQKNITLVHFTVYQKGCRNLDSIYPHKSYSLLSILLQYFT